MQIDTERHTKTLFLFQGPLLLLLGILLTGGCRPTTSATSSPVPEPSPVSESALAPAPDPLALISPEVTVADKIVNGAKSEARRGVLYDASYRKIAYPGGDVPADRGACTDVVIRALRHAGYDLQALIHQDMKRNYTRYPHRQGSPDANIDHRRGANHVVFLKHYGLALPTGTTGAAKESWQPGDLVYWKLGNGLDHCGVISNVRDSEGLPLVIHNISQAEQADVLTTWKIVAHFRYPVLPAHHPLH